MCYFLSNMRTIISLYERKQLFPKRMMLTNLLRLIFILIFFAIKPLSRNISPSLGGWKYIFLSFFALSPLINWHNLIELYVNRLWNQSAFIFILVFVCNLHFIKYQHETLRKILKIKNQNRFRFYCDAINWRRHKYTLARHHFAQLRLVMFKERLTLSFHYLYKIKYNFRWIKASLT